MGKKSLIIGAISAVALLAGLGVSKTIAASYGYGYRMMRNFNNSKVWNGNTNGAVSANNNPINNAANYRSNGYYGGYMMGGYRRAGRGCW